MARQSVSKHLAVLEAAGPGDDACGDGREKLHYLNAAPISDIGERWISRYDRGRVEALADLKRALEDVPMVQARRSSTRPTSAPRRSGSGRRLTDPAFTKRYWKTTLRTDWKPGATMTWDNHGVTIEDPGQVVLEADP